MKAWNDYVAAGYLRTGVAIIKNCVILIPVLPGGDTNRNCRTDEESSA